LKKKLQNFELFTFKDVQRLLKRGVLLYFLGYLKGVEIKNQPVLKEML
jgi:hypothetical protein